MFIQIIQGRCSREDEMRALTDRWVAEVAPGAVGWLGGTFGFTDDGQSIAVVRFESKEAAQANSERPEQAAWWAEAEQLFDGPVEFHDCNRVMLMLGGGSDEAKFVQVIRGKLDDVDALQAGMQEMTAMLHEQRPDILGATFAIEEDGTFIETVAFTDEASAREMESQEMPAEGPAAQMMQSWERMVHDVQYLDLHRPWFASKH
jgi:hypothetical protein